MGKGFNTRLMNTNWSQTEAYRNKEIRKQMVEGKRLGREKQAGEPLPLSPIEKEKLARRQQAEKLAGFERIIARYFDSEGDLYPGVTARRDVFRTEQGGRVSVINVDCPSRDMMRHLLLNGYLLEHPLGWTKLRSSPNPVYAPGGEPAPLFTCEICSKEFKSKNSLYGHMGAHRNKKEKSNG